MFVFTSFFSPMKLLIFTPNDNTGGTERVSAVYAHSLSPLGVHIRVCSIFKPLRKYNSTEYPSLHFSLYLSRIPRPLRPLFLYLVFCYFACRGYVLFVQGEYPAAISYFLPFRVFIRVTNLPDLLKERQPFLYKLFIKSLKKNICIFPSKYFQDLFPIAVPRSTVLPNPFSSSDLPLSSTKAVDFPLKFIAVGQLNHQKNHEFMISAFSSYLNQHSSSSKLYIYGDGPFRDKLSSLIITLGMTKNIFLMGWSSYPWSDNSFDFHLLTSRWEGYPNVIVESSFHRIPTLSLLIPPGIHSLINDNCIGLSSYDNSLESYVSLLSKASCKLKSKFTTSSRFDDFVSLHSPNLLISTINSYV